MPDEGDAEQHGADGLASGDWLGSSGAWAPVDDDSRYTRRALLGEGGMGRVVAAEDRLLRREVALKEALGAPDGPEAQRLRREARITAALDHPAIVPVYDFGEDSEGRPHFVMRLVRGRSLGEAIGEAQTYSDRLLLLRNFLTVVEAVAFAHHAGVVHRDLKPDNILVGPWGETQVMDWGLARTLNDDDWEAVVSRDFRTRAGAILGTPAYMSPEQASGEDIGPGVDVWALGAVLYELLSGARAFRGPSQREVIAQILSGSRTSLTSLVPEVDPDLAAIVERALAREPADRYPDAGAMATALEQWFDGRRNVAPKPTSARWVWPGAITLAALMLALLAALLLRSQPAPDSPDVRIVQDSLVLAARAASEVGERRRAELLAADVLSRGEHPGARGVLAAHGLDPLPQLLSSAPLPACRRSLLDASHGFLLCAQAQELTLIELDGTTRWRSPLATRRLAVDPAGEYVVAYNETSNIWLFLDVETGAPIVFDRLSFRLSSPRPGLSRVPGRHVRLLNGPGGFFEVNSVRDGGERARHGACGDRGLEWVLETDTEDVFVVVCTGRSIVRYHANTEREEPLLPPSERDSIAWTGATDSSGGLLVLGGVEGDLVAVDLKARRRVVDIQLSERMIRQVTVSPDGLLLAARDATGDSWVIPTEHPGSRYRVPGRASHLGFASDGTLIVSRAEGIERWSVPDPTVRVRSPLENGVLDLAWGAGGIAVAAGALTVLDHNGVVAHETPQSALAIPDETAVPPELRTVAWESDGNLVVAGREMGVHRFVGGAPTRILAKGGAASLLSSGHMLILHPAGVSPLVLDPTGERVAGVALPGWVPLSASLSPDGTHAALLGRAGDLYLATDGAPPTLEALPTPAAAFSLAVSNDGATLYYTTEDGVMVRGARDRDDTGQLLIPREGAGSLRLSADGAWVFVGASDGFVEVYGRLDGALRMQIAAHRRRVSGLAPSPAGDRLATGSWDRTLALWDLAPLSADRSALVSEARARWQGVAGDQ